MKLVRLLYLSLLAMIDSSQNSLVFIDFDVSSIIGHEKNTGRKSRVRQTWLLDREELRGHRGDAGLNLVAWEVRQTYMGCGAREREQPKTGEWLESSTKLWDGRSRWWWWLGFGHSGAAARARWLLWSGWMEAVGYRRLSFIAWRHPHGWKGSIRTRIKLA